MFPTEQWSPRIGMRDYNASRVNLRNVTIIIGAYDREGVEDRIQLTRRVSNVSSYGDT